MACDAGAAGRDGACTTCETDTVPNSERTACNECPEGESTTDGTCNADPLCLDIECTGPFKRCVGGACVCETGFVDDGTGTCARIDVDILEAAIGNDSIRVRLSPAFAAAGPLRIMVSADGMNAYEVYNGMKAGGVHDDFTFYVMDEIPPGGYSTAKAEWTVGGLAVDGTKALAPAFEALGDYRHSQYNTPDEEDCDGMDAVAYITEPIRCAFTADDLNSDFISQAAMNGSGRRDDDDDGDDDSYVQLESRCFDLAEMVPTDALRPGEDPGKAENADKKRSFRGNATISGACGNNTGALTDATVAVNKGHMGLGCDDSVLIVGFGVKTVTDYCPACKTGEEPSKPLPQLDNYTTRAACEPGSILDLGDELQTIKLLEPR